MQTTTKPVAKVVVAGLDKLLREGNELFGGARVERAGPGFESTIEFDGETPDPEKVLETIGEAELYRRGLMDRANEGFPLGVLVLDSQTLREPQRQQQGMFSNQVPGRYRARIEIFPYSRC